MRSHLTLYFRINYRKGMTLQGLQFFFHLDDLSLSPGRVMSVQ